MKITYSPDTRRPQQQQQQQQGRSSFSSSIRPHSGSGLLANTQAFASTSARPYSKRSSSGTVLNQAEYYLESPLHSRSNTPLHYHYHHSYYQSNMSGPSDVPEGSSPLERPAPPFVSHPQNLSTSPSQASSTHHQSVDGDVTPSPSGATTPLPPPQQSHGNGHRGGLKRDQSSVSLTVNYLPTKFSNTLLSPASVARYRKGKSTGGPSPAGDTAPGKATGFERELGAPKQGGGVDAFRPGASSRIPGEGDEDDDDGIAPDTWFSSAGAKDKDGAPAIGRSPRKLRWNRFKWTLFAANTLMTIYSMVALIFCLLTWFNVWKHADVVRVGNRTELIVSTLAATLGIITCIVGWAGILLNNRSFLAVYTFLLWITFIFLAIPGYLTYKKRTFNLEGKVNAQWSRDLGAEGRMRIQNQLLCCGYFNPYMEATISQTCYSRSILPGCKSRYINFEKGVLTKWYTVAFSIVPFHIFTMVAGLVCANHVTFRFGKGMMPKAYRLSMQSMAVIINQYASQLAEQYGPDVAQEVMARSRSTLLDGRRPVSGMGSGNSSPQYDSLRSNNSDGSS